MPKLARVGVLVLILSALPSLAGSTPTLFTWYAEPTEHSSAEITALDTVLHTASVSQLKGYPVENLVWREQQFELTMLSGTVYLEPPIDGVTTGGFFEGDATVTIRTAPGAARNVMEMHLNRAEIVDLPVRTAYLFSLRQDSPLAALHDSGVEAITSPPGAADVYLSDKSAMRQLGLDLTWLFLNREGPGAGATYMLFPMEEIRTSRSEEARVLYAFNPMNEVELAIFGHDEMVALKPHKFRFYGLIKTLPDGGTRGMIDLERARIKLSQGTGAESAVQDTELIFDAPPALKALRLNLNPQMKISRITGPDGNDLPFFQWGHRKNDPDFDPSLLVMLNGAPASISVHSEGVLFEHWFGGFYLIDEDDWCPSPHVTSVADELHFELDLTIPKKFTGIGAGEKTVDEVKGNERHIVYRTTKPAKSSTLYIGDYLTTSGKADDIEVELYQHRKNVAERKNAKFMMTEITNALKVYNRLYIPLDLDTLRVTSTMTQHGRGFEGLILLGGGGTAVAEDSSTDLFRAHEVAHQWWGNVIRPKRWPEDRWLSEAFAEFSAMEYYKIRFEEPARAVKLMNDEWILRLTEGQAHTTSLTGAKKTHQGGTIYPIASGTGNVYTKGPMVLQMLRYLFHVERGEESFFPMMQDFLRRYRDQAASTDDFQSVAEEHFGSELDWFFDQWLQRGGLPVVSWKYTLGEQQGKWVVRLQASQDAPHYRLLIPIYFHFPGDKVAVRPWLIEGSTGTRALAMPGKPSKVTLNDNLEALVILKPL